MSQSKAGLSSTMIRLNLTFFFLSWAGGIVFAIQRGLESKIPASFCFLILGIVNTCHHLKHSRQNMRFVWPLLTGLFFGFLADIVLELYFIPGAALFALGHAFYIIAYCCLLRKEPKDCRICAMILVPVVAIVLFLQVLDFGSTFMQAAIVVYAVIISIMVGKSVSNYRRNPSNLTKCLLIGSVLFFFSDFMLLFAFFTDIGRIASILCLITYYPGQAILASSIYHHSHTL